MIPNATKKKFMDGSIDLGNDTIRVALLENSTEYIPDPDTHEFVDDVLDAGVTGIEYSDTNYARQALTTQATSQDNTDDEGVFDADDVTFTAIGSDTGGQIVEAILVYKQVGADDTTPGDDPIIAILDDSEVADLEKQTNGEDFTIQWDAEGIINIT